MAKRRTISKADQVREIWITREKHALQQMTALNAAYKEYKALEAQALLNVAGSN